MSFRLKYKYSLSRGAAAPENPNLFINGDFATDVSSWTSSGTLIWDVGKAKLTTTNNFQRIQQSTAIPLVEGTTYRLTFDNENVDSAAYSVYDVSNAVFLFNAAVDFGPGHSVDFTAGASAKQLYFYGDQTTIGTSTKWDNLEVREV